MHLFGNGHWVSRKLQTLWIKWLGHEGPVSPEQQMTGCINGVGVGPENQFVLARIERAHVNAVDLFPRRVSADNSDAIKEVASIGEEVGEVEHPFLARLVKRQRRRRTAGIRNAIETAVGVGLEDDYTVAIPGTAAG